jgi:hypothetical protein
VVSVLFDNIYFILFIDIAFDYEEIRL